MTIAIDWLSLLAFFALATWLGLSWAAGLIRAHAGQWRESLLLNTRGLT